MDAMPIDVFRLEEADRLHRCPSGTSYYSISLIGMPTPGSGGLLCFHHPHTQQTGEAPAMPATGFSCLFNVTQLSDKMQRRLRGLPMFNKQGNPVYIVPPALHSRLLTLFEKMLTELSNNYMFKYELLANYLSQLIHQALKLQPDMHRLPPDDIIFRNT